MSFAPPCRPAAAPRIVSPVPPELTGGEAALDLLPIPAVLLELEEGRFRFEAFNRAFRLAGMGVRPERSLLIDRLGARIAAFVAREDARESWTWQVGDSVDTRFYGVTLARIFCRGVGRCLVTLLDQTAEQRAAHSLRREMTTDSLTGLPNRAGFLDTMETAMAGARERRAILMIDLDRFGRVNTCLGSMAGDELLITMASRLRGALRASDSLARTGGDEFGVLLSIEEGPSDAEHVAKRIRGALAAPFRLSDFEIRVSCSIGIALGADTTGDAEDLIRHAQFAVKRSKASGRAEFYQTQAFDALRERFAMETVLRRAIENDALRLDYQPICDLGTGRIIAFEALARWTDEAGIAHCPADFIPVAEESGLIVPLGRWALREATRTLAAWDARVAGNCGVDMAINVSAIQLQRDSIAPALQAALDAVGLAGSRIKLEITESALIADPDRIARTTEALKALGATLAMDDFGTGYSSLAYLQKLPIDILKIDRSFVTGMLADRDKLAIVRAVLSLAQALGMRTVAEGIETPECAQTLAALGCSYGQGYHFARPLGAEDAFAMLVERNVLATSSSASASTRG